MAGSRILGKKAKAKAKAAVLSPQQREKLLKKAKADAAKAIRENPSFRAFGALEIHGTIISEMSLMQKVTADKMKKLTDDKGAPAFGLPYYAALAAHYGAAGRSSGGSMECSPGAAAQPIRETLVAALTPWEDTPRCGEKLMEFLLCEVEEQRNKFL